MRTAEKESMILATTSLSVVQIDVDREGLYVTRGFTLLFPFEDE